MDTERLGSLDQYGHRKNIIPAEVKGFWRKHRDWTQGVLILFFLILPWLRVGGEQTLLLDISKREFIFFGVKLFSHDAPLIFFVLAILTVGLAFVTSVWGRVWCGWGCPQTVFIDGVYRRIEKWVAGNYLERRKLDQSELSFKKIYKISLTWALFTVVSALIAHSFLAYFVGARRLLEMMARPPSENWVYFVLVFSMTSLLLFDFGWFREQFCIIMCPYGRFQSVLLDSQSQTIFYDEKRGEPRKGSPLAAGEKNGDCVSCNRCVQVCPTGIDIRRGLQMECIACTACIDACDEIMEKTHRPHGLIRYASLSGVPIRIFRLKNMIYLFVILTSIAGLVWALQSRQSISYVLLRAKESPYTLSKDNEGKDLLTNHFRLHIKNQSNQPRHYDFSLEPSGAAKLVMASPSLALEPNADTTVHIFIQLSASLFQSLQDPHYYIKIQNPNSKDEAYNVPIQLVGPNAP